MNNQQNRRTAWVSRLALGFGASAALFLPSLAMAQAEPTADETIWGSSNSSDLMDVLQRGQVGSSQTRSEFRSKQSQSLSEAAAAFRALQQKVLEQEGLEQEALEATPPAPAMKLETKSAETEAEPSQSRPTEGSPRPALW